jgi:hypothetical protein
MGEQAGVSNDLSLQHAVLYGRWVGELGSKGSTPSALMTAISPDETGGMTAKATISSGCLAGASIDLEVTVDGETVSMAGSDPDGNSLTLQGTVDKTGAILTTRYSINGSATGRCEVDTGTGTLVKQ